MRLGKLEFGSVASSSRLLAPVTMAFVERNHLTDVLVCEIAPELSDTAAFCAHYEIGPELAANCVIVEAKRSDRTWYAACVILATSKADVNGTVRKHLGARKISFAPMEKAVSITSMEYGGISPLGLPSDWAILIDSRVVQTPQVILGSGIRGSKLLVPGSLLGRLPNAIVLDISKHEVK